MKKYLLLPVMAILAMVANAQQITVISSPNLHCDDTVRVYIPSQIAANYAPEYCVECCGEPQAAPALYLLHGWSGSWRNWGDKVDLQRLSDSTGFIIICPDGFYNSWYVNATDPQKMQWRTFFDKELYPMMKEKYYLSTEKTFITGLSMGGHGAINIFLDDTDRFRAAGSMSGVLDLRSTSLNAKWTSQMLGEFTPENRRYDEESALNRLTRAKGSDKIMLVSCGYSDFYATNAKSFCDKCKEEGVLFIELLSPGVHSWKYWDYALRVHLFYFDKILKGEQLGY